MQHAGIRPVVMAVVMTCATSGATILPVQGVSAQGAQAAPAQRAEAQAQGPAAADASHDVHAHAEPQTAAAPAPAAQAPATPAAAASRNPALPADEAGAKEALEKSPRHGEYADIQVPGRATPLRSFVVYPERKDKAPVVIVIHEIYGLSDWIRGVADQLARDGFIAIAPDLLSGKGPNHGGTDALGSRDEITKAVRSLTREEIAAGLNAVRAYGLALPAASGKSATIGFCFGGATSFWYAAATPDLNAAVVYYGTSPDAAALATIKAPVLGLYGGNDARVNATIEPAAAELKKLGTSYTPHIYDGAGHGFLRQQPGMDGANMKATAQAWPATLAFLRAHTK